jgi:hypothetical protein
MRIKHTKKSLLGRIAVIALTGTALVSFAAAAQAADLYVSPNGSDSNSGSQSAPFRSILAASQAAQAGTTVHVAAGTYDGGLTTTASGTASAHIIYVSDTPFGAKIVGAGTASNACGWWNKGNYVDIKGFEIDGSGSQATSWRCGFYGTGSYSTFQSNKVHDILTDSTAFANASANGAGGAGAEMDNYAGAVNGSLIGNIIYNIGPSGVTSSLVHGIYEIMSGTVANNIVYNVVGGGIQLWHGAIDMQIVNNTVDNARDGGINVGSGDSGSSSTTGDYITVANNIVTNSGWGISESGTTGRNNLYVDNLSYNNPHWDIKLQNGLVDTGTVKADPNFANAAAADYHLQSSSPAIGAGSASYDPSTDLDGKPRSTTAPSIGAYEGSSSTASNGGTPTGGTPTGGTPTGGTPTGTFPIGGLPTGSFPIGGLPSSSFPTGGLPSSSFPTGGLPTGGLSIGGISIEG